MDLEICPSCGCKVFVNQQGSCPNCRRPLGPAMGRPPFADAEPIVVAELAYPPSPPQFAFRPPMPVKLLVPGILVCLLGVLGVLNSIIVMVEPPVAAKSQDPDMQAAENRLRHIEGMAASPIVLILYLVMATGGVAMLQRQYWGLALAGAILSLVPCSCVTCLSLPVGVWSIIVLSMGDVRAGFR